MHSEEIQTQELQIQRLAQTYADGVMQRDAEIWGNTWAEAGPVVPVCRRATGGRS